MNLSDIKAQAVELEINLFKIQKEINALREITKLTNQWSNETVDMTLNYDIVGGSSTQLSNVAKLRDKAHKYFSNSLQALRNVLFMESFFVLAPIKDNFSYFHINDFIDNFKKCVETVHLFTSSGGTQNIALFIDAINAINNIINQYDSILENINQVKNLSSLLIGPEVENSFKIRLLSENNEISRLIQNITLIDSIYNNINKLIGDESKKLAYRRAESGTFELDLTGCINTLSALLPILTFSYKIYSENFSWKAKQEKQLGEVKVRGEYLKLIKEVSELKIEDSTIINNALGDLDLGIKELFSANPYIQVNDQKIGIQEMNGKNIPIEMLQSGDEGLDMYIKSKNTLESLKGSK